MAERRRRGRPRNDETPRPDVSEREQRRLRQMKSRVRLGRDERRRWRTDYRVDELAKAAYGSREEYNEFFGETETIWINKFDPTIKTMLPSLFFHAPQWRFEVMTNDLSSRRRQQSALISSLISRISQENRQLERATRFAVQQSMHSIGVIKIIYDPKMEPNPRKGDPIFRTDDADEAIRSSDTGDPLPLLDEAGEPVMEPDEIVSDEVYRIEWVNAENMILPPNEPDCGKWQWIAEEITVPVADAKEDKRFKASLRRQIRANVAPEAEEGFDDASNLAEMDEDDGEFRYIEYYDIKNKRYYAWADGGDIEGDGEVNFENELLFDEPLPRGIDDYPYAILLGYTAILDPHPKTWPLPLTYNWLPIEYEHNIRRQQLANGARHSARKVFYDQSTFKSHEDAVTALQSSVDMEAVEVQDVSRVPVVQADPPPSINISADLSALEGDWIRATGMSASAFGTRSGSATEARIESGAESIRESDLRRSVAMFMEELGHKLFQLVKATMTVDISVKMASMSDQDLSAAIDNRFGPGSSELLAQSPGLRQAFIDRFGDETWYKVNREDISFDAKVTVAPGSMKSRTLETERQQFIEFMTLVLQAPIALQSRELLLMLARMFEFVDDRVVDELVALGEKAAMMEAMKAGRFQGDGGGMSGAAAGAAAMQPATRTPSPSVNNGFNLARILGAG